MLKDITAAQLADDYCLTLTFEDGVTGQVNIAEMITFAGVFAPLADPAYFARVRVDAAAGTIVWPNGADLDPDVLYAHLTGIPLPG